MSSHKILSQAHLISHSFRHLHYHIVNSWPWLEKHNVGAVQIQKNHFIPETCGCLSTSTGIFLQVVPALTIRMFRSAASNIMLGVSTAGSSMDVFENQKSICSNVTCIQAKNRYILTIMGSRRSLPSSILSTIAWCGAESRSLSTRGLF